MTGYQNPLQYQYMPVYGSGQVSVVSPFLLQAWTGWHSVMRIAAYHSACCFCRRFIPHSRCYGWCTTGRMLIFILTISFCSRSISFFTGCSVLLWCAGSLAISIVFRFCCRLLLLFRSIRNIKPLRKTGNERLIIAGCRRSPRSLSALNSSR